MNFETNRGTKFIILPNIKERIKYVWEKNSGNQYTKKKSLVKSQEFDRCYILRSLIKSIEIFLKKQFIEICIFFNIKGLLISYKKS